MRVLLWHVHGSWTTALVQGSHQYLLPVLPDRGPDGRGRAQTWDWPPNAVEIPVDELRDADIDVVILQRPIEPVLLRLWTGRVGGADLPAVYVEHNAPPGPAAASPHPLAGQTAIPVVHVTHYNRLMWDCGAAPTTVVEHGVVDPGYRYTGEHASLAAVVNEPVRRWRVAGTDLLVELSRELPLDVYGMGMAALAELEPGLTGRLHENLPQAELHAALGRHRAYFHPYRWTSLGLALVEAMTLGLPVLAWSTTGAPDAVPSEAGVLTADPSVLADAARRWLYDADEAREMGRAARRHALEHFGLQRFLADWDRLLKEVTR
ncbi:MAG TPA: glycosyltransferase family 4 protein [Jiangellaceae bacterium]|nr:glycosyltransferase family 4 protein [Jiangellaceae bacterium]